MTNAQALLDHRRHVWTALAPLWLDREPVEHHYQRMIVEINRLALDRPTLEEIYRIELAPVLARYQASMAGNWRDFEEEPLLHALMRHNLRLSPWKRRFWWLLSGLTTTMTRHRWQYLMDRVFMPSPDGANPPQR
ncbi:DUF7079 family protein [Kushneria phosphatilytica]|uniref:DUF7079 domain-containing protein n=1 Tax=Kushneria phosphatilytica TaxID=657387 RepID=A0A1S1NS98_9GAMM|nr:hypothetical protein [Kushneria phosphatilytica]OHV07809.1 hypothetical protein BH688_16680 [Kushneria phosphatilytica]QEL10317.1 hypothetical protein FY550_03605 [Kushneria phosphatilytica]